MDVELEKRINEAIVHLKSMMAEDVDYELMDPIAKMMLVALLYETQKIRDYIDGLDSKIMDRFCENFIPMQQTQAMPAVSLVAPVFKKNKNTETVQISSGVSFSLRLTGNKTPINFIPLLKNILIPYDNIYVLSNNKMRYRDLSYDISMGAPNVIWVGINTQSEIDSLEGFSVYLQMNSVVSPKSISVFGVDNKELDFCTISKMEEIEMLEPFDAQQFSGNFLSIIRYWRNILQELPNGLLLYFTDKSRDRDLFKKRAYPKVFQNWLESEILDCFNEDILWLRFEFPENFVVDDDCNVIPNVFPVVNVDVNNVTLTQSAPIAKLQKQEDSFFISVLETDNSSHKQGFPMSSDEFVIRDFDASCYHNGDLYRDIRNLYSHFVEDYYAFVEYNGIKDGQDIKRLKELVNKIGKSVGEQSAKYKFDSGTYVMKNINQQSQSTVTKVSFLTTQGELGNLLTTNAGKDSSSKFECKKLPLLETNVPVIVSATGGRDKATADQKYELIRYYSLTNDRLFTKMDVEAFVRKELVTIYGKEEFKRISVNVHVEGAAGQVSVQRGLYVDIEFKDKKNHTLAIGNNLEMKLKQKIKANSCISMPIIVAIKLLE